MPARGISQLWLVWCERNKEAQCSVQKFHFFFKFKLVFLVKNPNLYCINTIFDNLIMGLISGKNHCVIENFSTSTVKNKDAVFLFFIYLLSWFENDFWLATNAAEKNFILCTLQCSLILIRYIKMNSCIFCLQKLNFPSMNQIVGQLKCLQTLAYQNILVHILFSKLF